MADLRFLTLSGSSRSGSYNSQLASAFAADLRADGQHVDELSLGDFEMPLFNEDWEAANGLPEATHRLAELMLKAHGVFIANPEYNSSLTPLLKNTLDWLSRVKVEGAPPAPVFKKKAIAIGGASPGGFGGIRAILHLRQVLAVGLGGLVIAEQVLLPNASKAFAEDGSLIDERPQKMLSGVVQALIREAENAARNA